MRSRPHRRPDWCRLRAHLPMTIALAGVAAVWVVGCVWSFTEQQAFAQAHGFGDPALLPLALDGLAASMAAVAFAASLDGRPAIAARLVTAFGVAASAASNATWAAERSHVDPATIAMGVVMPVVANLAFEVLLGELRRQVQRARGLPAPAAIPTLRIVRLVLAPRGTFTAWRRIVLEVTALDAPAGSPPEVPEIPADSPAEEDEEEPEETSQPDTEPQPTPEPAAAPPAPRPRRLVPHASTRVLLRTPPRLAPSPPAQDTPPAPTGHKLNDARAWYLHERRRGEHPSAKDVNDQIGSAQYVKGHHLAEWEQELGRERLSVVGQ